MNSFATECAFMYFFSAILFGIPEVVHDELDTHKMSGNQVGSPCFDIVMCMVKIVFPPWLCVCLESLLFLVFIWLFLFFLLVKQDRKRLAQKAIKFINRLLTTRQFVIAQTPFEAAASAAIYGPKINDDHIVGCALQWANNGQLYCRYFYRLSQLFGKSSSRSSIATI